MANVRKAFVRDGVVHCVYFDDETTLAEKLAPIASDLVDCEETVQPGWLHDGSAFIDPASLIPPPTTRQKRRAEYFEVLRVEAGDDQITVLGDQVDKLIAQVEAMRAELGAKRTAEFSDLLTKLVAVKTKFPKPPA